MEQKACSPCAKHIFPVNLCLITLTAISLVMEIVFSVFYFSGHEYSESDITIQIICVYLLNALFLGFWAQQAIYSQNAKQKIYAIVGSGISLVLLASNITKQILGPMSLEDFVLLQEIVCVFWGCFGVFVALYGLILGGRRLLYALSGGILYACAAIMFFYRVTLYHSNDYDYLQEHYHMYDMITNVLSYLGLLCIFLLIISSLLPPIRKKICEGHC